MSIDADEVRLSRLLHKREFWPYRVEHCEFWTDIELMPSGKFCSAQKAAYALREIACWIEGGVAVAQSQTETHAEKNSTKT